MSWNDPSDMAQQGPRPGWYPDPAPGSRGSERWWDGGRWSQTTRPAGLASPAAAVPAVVDPVTGTTGDERTWALMAHLGALIGFGFLAPLIVYLVKKDESAFVRAHAARSLNFHLSWLIWTLTGFAVTFVLAIVTFGLVLFLAVPALLAVAIGLLVLSILATVKASRGEPADGVLYPLSIGFVR